MRFIFLSIIALSFLCGQCGEKKAACHDMSATEEFADLSKDKAFQDAHPSPIATDTARLGAMIQYPVAEEKGASAYFVKAPNGETKSYLLLIHEWWGLNENIKREADQWAKELNVNVLALDLYDGKLATDAETAGKLMQANNEKRSAEIIKGAIAYAGDGADFRTMGWCFGGGWSLQASLLAGTRSKACVMYYGMPEKDLTKLKGLNAPVVFIHPLQDKWINQEVVDEFTKNMKAVDKKLNVYQYDADHAFANPSSPKHNEQAAKEARVVVADFLKNVK